MRSFGNLLELFMVIPWGCWSVPGCFKVAGQVKGRARGAGKKASATTGWEGAFRIPQGLRERSWLIFGTVGVFWREGTGSEKGP